MLQCRTEHQPHKSIVMMSCFQLAHDVANVPGPEVHVLSQGSSRSDTESLEPVERWTMRSAKASAPQGGVHSQTNMFHCTGKFASQMCLFAIWLGGQVVPREGKVPRVIRQQRWSPLNVPLLWSAAGVEETSPVLDWLASVAGHAPSC